VERPEENNHLDDLRLQVRMIIIIKWILKKSDGKTNHLFVQLMHTHIILKFVTMLKKN